ncbi:DUF3592 domain-containing protein [Pelomonas cellulosilytica]|uniref:DUF3592 domain-containing protein n=1 Tax=Pelomonas cellulosilytica TaxID=2906762 RepID=A0ABS8XY12_9BURK|nr:DUF3592 domain-containing protein [Pelomonas sp. P8]MCE4556173.1 DUF3592 domain-containing protein [Pelomonas sp. P8]
MHNKNKNSMVRGWRARAAMVVMGALFALGFGSVGLYALKSLTALLHNAWAVRSWQAVAAEVLDSSLQTIPGSEGGSTFAVRPRYRYQWQGRTYESTRVGVPAGLDSDNLDDWHHRWSARLAAAREGRLALQAWVDPRHPGEAVLDRQLRWRQVVFMLPFAVLFPLVGAGALIATWRMLRSTEPGGQLTLGTQTPGAQRHTPRHNLVALWSATVFVGMMALGIAGAASGPSAPGWTSLVAGLMLLLATALAYNTLRTSRDAWAYRGAFASFQPPRPTAGTTVDAMWVLPPHVAVPAHVRLRIAHYRIDDSGSGTTERLVEELNAHAQRILPAPDGLRLLARFDLPADAPSEGARRSGDKVAWRFEWLDPKGRIVMAVPLLVQADASISEPAVDRLSRQARVAVRDLPAGPLTDTLPPLPPGVCLQERPDALVLSFGQTGWRRFGAVALLALAVTFSWTKTREDFGLWLELPLLAIAVHAVSRRWTLQARDDGLVLDNASWLWRRRISLPVSCLQAMGQRWLYSRNGPQGEVDVHTLVARGVDRGGDLRLTPGLPAEGAAQIAQMLRWASAQRGGRFSPGERRADPAPWSRPGWGWTLCLLWGVARLSTGA